MDIYDISWSPTSQFLVSSGTDSNIIIWGIDGTQYVRLHDHSGYIQGIDWSRDDVSIVSVANDRTARVYSYARGRVNPSLQTEDWTALAAAALRSEFRISRSVVHNKPREPGSGVACSGLPRRAQETPFCRGRNRRRRGRRAGRGYFHSRRTHCNAPATTGKPIGESGKLWKPGKQW